MKRRKRKKSCKLSFLRSLRLTSVSRRRRGQFPYFDSISSHSLFRICESATLWDSLVDDKEFLQIYYPTFLNQKVFIDAHICSTRLPIFQRRPFRYGSSNKLPRLDEIKKNYSFYYSLHRPWSMDGNWGLRTLLLTCKGKQESEKTMERITSNLWCWKLEQMALWFVWLLKMVFFTVARQNLIKSPFTLALTVIWMDQGVKNLNQI